MGQIVKKLLSWLLILCITISIFSSLGIIANATTVYSQEVKVLKRVYDTLEVGRDYIVTAANKGYLDIYVSEDCPIDTAYYVTVDGNQTNEYVGTIKSSAQDTTYAYLKDDKFKKYHIINNSKKKYGFDDCDGVFVWDTIDNCWRYWCDGSGVRNLKVELYECNIETTTIDELDISATLRDGVKFIDNGATQKVKESQILVTITTDGQSYELESQQYKLIDNKISNGDNTVTVQYGNLKKDIYIPIFYTIELEEGDTSRILYKENGKAIEIPTTTSAQYSENKNDYNFVGWSTDPDDITAEYMPGVQYSKDKSIRLYPIWGPQYGEYGNVYIQTSQLNDGTYKCSYSEYIEAFDIRESTMNAKRIYGNFEILDGNLPNGLSLNSSTGEVYGEPIEIGDFTVTVKMKSDAGEWISESKTITLTINPMETNDTYYSINTNKPSNGMVSSNKVEASKGTAITITVKASDGYKMDSLSIIDKYEDAVPYTNIGDGIYKIIMPASDITVQANFTGVTDIANPEDTGVSDVLLTDEHIKYINGYTTGDVRPNGNMTRSEVAQMFYNLLHDKNPAGKVQFIDIQEEIWCYDAITTLADRGIIKGYIDGTYQPNNAITRAEFAAIAMRFANMTTGNCQFSDVTESHWAYDYIMAATEYGWIKGYADGTYRPDYAITRAEVVTIVNHMLGRFADKEYVDYNPKSLHQFRDLKDQTKWYYYDMVEATNAHIYKMPEFGMESWLEIK